MAEIAALNTLRFEPSVAGPLQTLISPPYDVIDDAMRERLTSASEHNVVEIDLPVGDDKYAAAARTIDAWREAGVLVQEDEPAIWLLRQSYTGPDGAERTRHGIFCRVRVTDYGPGLIRPHERTHPGPKADRLALMHATGYNLSPIFSVFSDAGGEFRELLGEIAKGQPDQEADDLDGNGNSIWRVSDAERIAALTQSLADKELLIADGHHRYETARTYAAEIGGAGEHEWVLMFLCALEDPGMTVFATHRLIEDLSEEQQAKLEQTFGSKFSSEPVEQLDLAPEPSEDTAKAEFGFLDETGTSLRLTLADRSALDGPMAGKPDAYRELDTAILEELVLKDALGMDDHDIAELVGLGYSSNADEARSLVDEGEYAAAFFLRPTPIAQIVAIAQSGADMPPKSTYFYPKIPTGIVFNPLR